MNHDNITQIRVSGHRTGIIGLHSVLERVAEEYGGRPDEEITAALMERFGKLNYMEMKARDKYASAFLRAYKKFVGQPFEEDVSGPVQVKVLGPGCPNCERLEQEIIQVLTETKLPVDLEHVRDPAEIGAYGMVPVPALVVDNTVVASGRVPQRAEMKTWLQQAADRRKTD